MYTIKITANIREQLIEITAQVQKFLRKSAVQNGIVNVYAQGAMSAIMIQENWDDSVKLMP